MKTPARVVFAALLLSQLFPVAAQELILFEANKPARAVDVNNNLAALKQEVALRKAEIDALRADLAALRVVAARLTPRPAFFSDASASPTRVVVPATTVSPIRANLAGTIVTTDSTLACDLAVSGPGGLDAGIVLGSRLYYLYLVPGAEPSSLATLASLNPPTSGPVLSPPTSPWTYLGSFWTAGNATVLPFVFAQGTYYSPGGSSAFEVSTTSTTQVPFTLNVPAHATVLRGRFRIYNGSLGGSVLVASATTGGITVLNSTSATSAWAVVELPLIDSRTIYLASDPNGSGTTPTVVLRPLGWTEDPTQFP